MDQIGCVLKYCFSRYRMCERRGRRRHQHAGSWLMLNRTSDGGTFSAFLSTPWTGRMRRVRVYKRDVNYKGYVHHASQDDPQYEIRSDKTDHVALHKGRALRRLSR